MQATTVASVHLQYPLRHLIQHILCRTYSVASRCRYPSTASYTVYTRVKYMRLSIEHPPCKADVDKTAATGSKMSLCGCDNPAVPKSPHRKPLLALTHHRPLDCALLHPVHHVKPRSSYPLSPPSISSPNRASHHINPPKKTTTPIQPQPSLQPCLNLPLAKNSPLSLCPPKKIRSPKKRKRK